MSTAAAGENPFQNDFLLAQMTCPVDENYINIYSYISEAPRGKNKRYIYILL